MADAACDSLYKEADATEDLQAAWRAIDTGLAAAVWIVTGDAPPPVRLRPLGWRSSAA